MNPPNPFADEKARLKGKHIKFDINQYQSFFHPTQIYTDPITLYNQSKERIVMGTIPTLKVDYNIEPCDKTEEIPPNMFSLPWRV